MTTRTPQATHATRNSVGSDILLARHGSSIASMRLDRPRDRVVAVLDDGTLDCAPNRICPSLDMTAHGDDAKLILLACAATVGLAVVLTAAMGLVLACADPTQLARIMSALGTAASVV